MYNFINDMTLSKCLCAESKGIYIRLTSSELQAQAPGLCLAKKYSSQIIYIRFLIVEFVTTKLLEMYRVKLLQCFLCSVQCFHIEIDTWFIYVYIYILS